MDTEKKEPVTETTQAPAQSKEPEKKEEKVEAKPGEGIEAFVKDPKRLRELYNKSPQMFKDAGLDLKEEKKEDLKPVDKKPESAAPQAKVAKYVDKEIKLPDDLPVNEESLKTHLDHWKEQGFSPEQVQREVDFMTQQARAEKKRREEKAREVETPVQKAQREDAENVKLLQADPEFGKDFKSNMEIARRAALKFGNKDVLARMTTSDPVLVKHFWDLGKLDAEDRTPTRGASRTGEEKDEKKNPRDPKSRYPNTQFGS